MKRIVTLAALALLAVTAPASTQSLDETTVPGPAPAVPPSPSEAPAEVLDTTVRSFVDEARALARFQLETAKLAEQRADRPEIRTFAGSVVDEQAPLERRLGRLLGERAGTKDETGSTTRPVANPKRMLKPLEEANPGEFDPLFLEAQAEALTSALALYTSYSQTAEDPALRDFAMATIRVLQRQQHRVAELQQ